MKYSNIATFWQEKLTSIQVVKGVLHPVFDAPSTMVYLLRHNPIDTVTIVLLRHNITL